MSVCYSGDRGLELRTAQRLDVCYSGDRGLELRTAQRLDVCLLFWRSWARIMYGPEISYLAFHFLFWVDSSDSCLINHVTPPYEVTKHYLLFSH
jgi:hypothetical protein